MRREAPVRFLGGGGAAMHCCYPTNGHDRPLGIVLHCSHSIRCSAQVAAAYVIAFFFRIGQLCRWVYNHFEYKRIGWRNLLTNDQIFCKYWLIGGRSILKGNFMVKMCGVFIGAVFFSTLACAQNQIDTGYKSGWDRSGQGVTGTGSNTGSGYQPSADGYVGTGNTTGGGWARTGDGYSGTGTNVGRGNTVTDQGMVGTGANTGGGWARTGNGTCVGTGTNVGKSVQAPGC